MAPSLEKVTGSLWPGLALCCDWFCVTPFHLGAQVLGLLRRATDGAVAPLSTPQKQASDEQVHAFLFYYPWKPSF